MPLATEDLLYPVEALSPFSRPFCLRGLQLVLFVEVRASQHGEQILRSRKRQGVHDGATNKHCYARHYFRISAGMSPCLISMPLVAMARATSTMTMPTSRGVKSRFGYAQSPSCQAGHIPLRGQRLLRCDNALTSILPSVAGVVMVLLHIVGVMASLQLGRFIPDFGRGVCRDRRATGAQAHLFARKDIHK